MAAQWCHVWHVCAQEGVLPNGTVRVRLEGEQVGWVSTKNSQGLILKEVGKDAEDCNQKMYGDSDP